jgi:hypothetical protein
LAGRFDERELAMSVSARRPQPGTPQTTTSTTTSAAPPLLSGGADEPVLGEIRRLLGTLRYGSLTVVVQDGRVVQIETTSKLRLTAGGNGS